MRRRRGLGLTLRNRLQHIARLGDVRQVDLGLKFVARRSRARATASTRRLLTSSGEVLLHALGFIFLDGAGVRLLFRHADHGKNVEDRPALDLKFSRQIVNSNLVLHSALLPPLCPAWLRLHSILTV